MNKIIREYILNNFKTFSFDIFDTLVLRSVKDPRDIFKEVQLEIKNILDDDFVFDRIAAEKRARKRSKSGETTLDSIYDELLFKYDHELLVKLKQLEIDREISSVYAREINVKLFYQCLDKGKDVYLISDMYLPECVILQMLNKCRISGYRKLYVSGEQNCGKRTGQLYQAFISENNIIPSYHLHIGDSIRSDLIQARNHNLNAMIVPRRHGLVRLFNSHLGKYKKC